MKDFHARSGFAAVISVSLSVGLVLYVLSIGPALFVSNWLDTEEADAAWGAFYAPLWWLDEKVPSLDPVFMWYLRLFAPD